MSKIEYLEGKSIALVGLGISQVDFAVGLQNGKTWDEVWTINSAAAVYKTDRMFMLDPASRFFDSNDAGKQTSALTRILPTADYPIYTCELDNRVPNAVVYPIQEVCNATKCAYLNNTVAYATSDPATITLSIRYDNAIQTPTGTGIGTAVTRTIGTLSTGGGQ